jgi:hypothetical protein
MKIPSTPQDIRDFIGTSFGSAEFVLHDNSEQGIQDIPAHENDKYQVTAHDLLEAFSSATMDDYATFDDWWNEVENFSTRGERLMETVELQFTLGLHQYQRDEIKKLAQYAWRAARGENF